MTTTNLGLTKPTVGADSDAWGDDLNGNIDIIDTFGTRATRQVLTSGSSATYTTPTNCRQIVVRMKAGGGGGNGSGNVDTVTSGGTGGDTIFNSIHAAGGTGGNINGTAGQGGSGGTGTASVRFPGATGIGCHLQIWTATNFVFQGGEGGGLGGPSTAATATSTAGAAAAANSGAGGAGGGIGSSSQTTLSSLHMGAGGGEGEYVELIINSPAATYTYTIGAGGSGGTGGTSGAAGGAGGSGIIIVEEHY